MILNFNAATVAPQQAFENLPTGWYVGRVVASEEKSTKAGTGSYLQLEFEIIAPQNYAGRKVWEILNLKNPNATAVEIAYQTLSAICHATGVILLQQPEQLFGIPMDIKIGLSKPQDGYEQRNEIKGYRPMSSAAATGAVSAPASTGAQWQQPAAMAAPAQQAAPQGQWQQPVTQAQPQAQAAQWQQPQAAQPQVQAMPQAAPAQQWQATAQPTVAESQQQAHVAQQPEAQPAWANGAPQQGPAPTQQQQAVVNQGPAPEIQVVQQAAPDPAAQQAAVAGKAPWQQ